MFKTTHTYRSFMSYYLIFQVLVMALGVPVFVRQCRMIATEMGNFSKEISLFSRKDSCCDKVFSKKQPKNKPKSQKIIQKKSCQKPLNPCCTFESHIWQADIEQSGHFEASFSPFLLFLFSLTLAFAFVNRFFEIFFIKKNLSRYFSFRPPPKIAIWLRVRCVIR